MALAAVCTALTGEDGIEIRDWPVGAPGAGEIKVAVRAASVNFPDVLMVRGLYQHRPEPPFVPGSEAAGVVTDVGEGVSTFTPGDRVLLVGGSTFATELNARVGGLTHRIPDEMPFDEAAAFTLTYGTSYNALVTRGAVQEGEWVLVTGAAGGCGSAAVEIAKARGARVIAVVGGEEKAALATRLGADAVIDHTTVDALAPVVKELTGGHGVDVFCDNVGAADARDFLRCMAWNGRFLVVGFASGDIPAFKANQTILKCISIVGVAYGMSAMLDPANAARELEALFDWYRAGKVRPAVTAHFPLAQTADAMRVLQERRALGKVVVEMPA
ncbi:MAG: NADPH:quinone oxidoreductase family protein [Acidimicrobiia bacterium]